MRSKRIDEIISYIYENKNVTLKELCEKFQMSMNTIRRDLDEIMSTQNDIIKTYGGITVQNKKELIPFSQRNISNPTLKESIAKKACEFVQHGDTIFLDSGTTTMYMVDYLKDLDNITIFTHSLEVIMRAVPYENLNVISLPGILNRKTFSFTGTTVVESLAGYNIPKAFMASTGISSTNGATNSSMAEFNIKSHIITNTQQLFLLVDHTKFDVVSLMTYAPLNKFDYLITDQNPSQSITNEFQETNSQIIISL